VPLCLSRKGWFSDLPNEKKASRSKGGSQHASMWGTCIDLPLPHCEDVLRCSSDDGEILFRDEELLIDDKGLRLLDDMHGDQGWHHVLSSARRASAHAQDCDDTLSVASTHVEEQYSAATRSPSFCSAFRRGGDADFRISSSSRVDSKRSAAVAPRTRIPHPVSLSGLGIKPKSPKSGAQSPANLAGRLTRLSLPLPKLTDAFPERGNVLGGRLGSGGVGFLSTGLVGDDVRWTDREAMKAKYAPQSGWGKQTRKMDIKFCNIRKLQKVGKGNTSVVWKCEDVSTRKPLALKEVMVRRDDPEDERQRCALRELITMYGVDHVGVVTCHNVFYSNHSFHLVMELMDGGSLLDAMRRWCSFDGSYCMPPAVLAKVGHDVLGALAFLHDELQVVHRDVKPGNILLNCDGQAKLADLGIVTHPGQVQVDPRSQPVGGGHMHTLCSSECTTPAIEWIGTVTYMSPERLTGDAYSFSADMWSLGLVLVEAAIGCYPLTELGLGSGKLEFWDLLDIVRNGECPSTVVRNYGTPGQCKSLKALAALCLAKDDRHRPRASQLLDASFPGVVTENGDFFLDLAVDNGRQALADWVTTSLIRGDDALSMDMLLSEKDIAVGGGFSRRSVHDSVLVGRGENPQEGLVDEEGLEVDGWV